MSSIEAAVEEGEISESPEQIRPSQVIKDNNLGILSTDPYDNDSLRVPANTSIPNSSSPVSNINKVVTIGSENNQPQIGSDSINIANNHMGSGSYSRPNASYHSFNKPNGRGGNNTGFHNINNNRQGNIITI